MPLNCATCSTKRGILKRPKTGKASCKECFFQAFEDEIHHTITTYHLFQPGDKVAIAASGGKDSTVLAHTMKLLNERHNYGLDLFLLSIDEGITGYRDDSLETVKRNKEQYGLPLKVVSYKELYGWTMDAIVQKIGLKSNCTFCGVFRRQALDRGAMMLNVDKIVTGHNADDIAETVLMNILRGDIARLRRCTAITTGSEGAIPRSKPFKYTYEKEIVMYAYFKKLDYFSTECVYSPNAYRGHARAFLKDLESIRSSVIIDIIFSGDTLLVKEDVKMPVQGTCKRCGYISSQELCKACLLLEGLNRGLPRLGVGKVTGNNLAKYVKKMQLKEEKEKEKDGRECESQQRGACACGDFKHEVDTSPIETEHNGDDSDDVSVEAAATGVSVLTKAVTTQDDVFGDETELCGEGLCFEDDIEEFGKGKCSCDASEKKKILDAEIKELLSIDF